MKPFHYLSTVLLTVLYSCNQPVNSPKSNNDYQVLDASTIKATIDSTYSTFSYKRGVRIDTEKIRAQFLPEARIIIFDDKNTQNLSVTQFVNFMAGMMKGQNLDSFENIETGGRTEEFGHLAHRISSFKLYVNTRDTVADRGVASFQLVKTSRGWKVSAMAWDTQNPAQHVFVPAYYIQSK